MKVHPETPHSIRGIRSQIQMSINNCRDGATAEIPVGLAYRLLTALDEFKQMKLEQAGVKAE